MHPRYPVTERLQLRRRPARPGAICADADGPGSRGREPRLRPSPRWRRKTRCETRWSMPAIIRREICSPPRSNTTVAMSAVAGLVGVALWLIVAGGSWKGNEWARTTGSVLFGLDTLDLLIGPAGLHAVGSNVDSGAFRHHLAHRAERYRAAMAAQFDRVLQGRLAGRVKSSMQG